MITGNCTKIEKFSKCYPDVNKFFIVGVLRPEHEKRFGRKWEYLYWKIILPCNIAKFWLILKMWKDVSKTILCTSNLKFKYTVNYTINHKIYTINHFLKQSFEAIQKDHSQKGIFWVHLPHVTLCDFATLSPQSRLRKIEELIKTRFFSIYGCCSLSYM